MSVEEIKNLVTLEKESEEKIRKAEEKAANLIEKAREKARKILQEAESPEHYDTLFKTKSKEIGERKKAMENEVEEEVQRIQKAASKNLDKTVALIVKNVLGE